MSKNKRNNELYDALYKKKIMTIINSPLNQDIDENDCRELMSLLAEAKRYISNKIKVCRNRICNIELEIEIMCAEIADSFYKSHSGSATERKALIETAQILDSRYKDKYEKMYNYQEMLNGYLADLENLSDKTFAVRKIADFERIHFMYEE